MVHSANSNAATTPGPLSPTAAANKVKITGHRGARGIAPENTLAGFQVALDLGVDMIELDVHLTCDGELAVMHDPRVERTTDGAGAVGTFTLANLKRLDAAAKFNSPTRHGVQRVPTLQEVYDLVGDRCTINVEVKLTADGTRYAGIEEKLVEFLHRNDPANRTVISSFDHPTLVRIHELEPRLMRHGIVSREYFAALPAGPLGIQVAVDDFVSRRLTWMAINQAYLTADLCAQMKRAGLTVHAWIIDDLEGLVRFASMGVDQITSDRPDVLLAARRA